MAGFDDVVGKYLEGAATMAPLSEQKQMGVASTSADKQNEMSAPRINPNNRQLSPFEIAAARFDNRGVISGSSQEEVDAIQMSPGQLYLKYGQAGLDAGGLRSAVSNKFQRASNAQSGGFAQDAQDATRDVALGFAGGVVDLTGLAAGALNADAGNWIADRSQSMSEWGDEQRSSASQLRQEAYSARNSVTSRDNEQLYQDERKDMSSFEAGLRRIGRDAMDATAQTLEDDYLTRNIAATGVGSIFVGGPMAKGLGLVGRGVLKAGMKSGAVSFGAARKALQVGEKIAVPAAVGLQEGGGAYRQAVMDAQMRLAGRTDLTQEEKNQIANEEGLIAAGITAPVAGGIGMLPGFSALEKAPFRVGSLRGAGLNIGKETLEEGIQSATGQMAGNLAPRITGTDPNRDISEGVGEQMAQGAIGGLGTAGAVQAPGVALRGVQAAGQGALGLAGSAVGALIARGDRALEAAGKESSVSNENLSTNMQAATEAMPIVSEKIRSEIDASDATPEQKAQTYDYLERLNASTAYAPSQRVLNNEDLALTVEGATDKFDAMRMLGELAGDEEMYPEARIAAANELMSIIQENQSLIGQELPEALSKLPEDHAGRSALRGYQRVLSDIDNNKGIGQAMEAAMRQAAQATVEDVSADAVQTPLGQAQVELQVNAAARQPSQSNPEVLAQILAHHANGVIELSPTDTKIVLAARDLQRAGQAAKDQAKAMNWRKNIDLVTNQITSDETDPEESKKSMEAHYQGIVSAVKAGDLQRAGANLEDLLLFAKHMQNKVRALNTAFTTGKTNDREAVSYLGLIPNSRDLDKRFAPKKQGVWVSPKKHRSIDLAQQVALEATMVGTLANNLLTTFPEVADSFSGLQHVELASLDQGLVGDSRTLAKGYASGTTKVPANETDTSDTGPAEPSVQTSTQPETKEAAKTEVEQAQNETEAQPSVKTEEKITPVSEPIVEQSKEDDKPTEAPKTEPEPVQETPAEPEAMDPQTEAYASLLGSEEEGSKVRNFFRRSFKVVPDASRVALGNGFDVVRNAMSEKGFRALLGPDARFRSGNPKTAKAYRRYMNLAENMANDIDARIALARKKDPGLFKIANGVETNRYVNGKVLNLMEMNDKGQFRYGEAPLQAAVLAGMQWAIVAQGMKRNLDTSDLAQILGVDEADAAQFDDRLNGLNATIGEQEAIQMLGDMITQFMGVRAKPDADLSYTKGIPQAMAAEVIMALENRGILTRTSEQFVTENGPKTLNRISFSERDEDVVQTMRDLKGWPNLIETIALKDPGQTTYVNEIPSKVPQFQHRSRTARVTDTDKEMIRNANAIANKPNQTMIDFMIDIEAEGNLIIFGEGDLSGLPLNKKHRATLEGRNLSISSAFESLQGQWSEILNTAGENDPFDADVHYAYTVTSVGRLMALGAHNPQSSKLMREMFMPTRTTLDMSVEANRDMFMLAMAQHLGVKIHKQSREDSIAAAHKILNTDLADAVEYLKDYMASPSKLSKDDAQELRELLGSHNSYAAVHSLMEYARLEQTNAETEKAFTTHMYIEADGVTNGPMMALMMYGTGTPTAHELEMLEKGGFMVGKGKTLDTTSTDGTLKDKLPSINSLSNKVDLYEAAAKRLKELLSGGAMVKRNPTTDVDKHFASLRATMQNMLGAKNFKLVPTDTGLDLTIDRGILKNPLTVTLYGSGPKGIATKIASALLDEYYAIHSQLLADPDDALNQENWAAIQEDLEPLLKSTYGVGKKGPFIAQDRQYKGALASELSPDYELSPKQIENLVTNVRTMFVSDMQAAIGSIMGTTEEATTSLRRAIQIQSIYFQTAFDQEIQKALAAKKSDPDAVRAEFLSQKELDEIFAKLGHLAPYVSTGDQNFLMAGSERGYVPDPTDKNPRPQPKELSRSILGDMASDVQVARPVNAGVRGIPFMTIGPGDGRMIQLAATGRQALDRVGYVYDGINLPLDKAEEFSTLINGAATEAALGNPLRSVLDSFRSFLKEANLDLINESDQAKVDMDRALSIGEGTMSMDELLADLEQYADEIDARHAAMREVGMVVDHMAGTESPYQIGKNEFFSDEEQPGPSDVVADLVDAYDAKLADIRKEAKVSEDIEEELRGLGTRLPNGAVRVLGSELAQVANGLNIPKDQKDLINAALASPSARGVSVIMGSRAQINDQITRDGIPVAQDLRNEASGLYSNNTIYLYNANSETLAHELIHATTFNVVADHYADPQDGVVKQSVERLEKLMDQWLKQDFAEDTRSEDAANVFYTVRGTVEQYLAEGNKAAALNEFMAWSLSNQTVATQAKSTIADKLARIASAAIRAIKSLFVGPMEKVGLDLFSNIRFNTKVLMAQETQASLSERLSNTILAQNRWFGENNRVAGVREAFNAKIGQYVAAAASMEQTVERKIERSKARTLAQEVFEHFTANGFPMTMQQKGMFTNLVTAFATSAEFDGNTMNRIQKLYDQAIDKMSFEDFLKHPETNDENDQRQAREKFQTLVGKTFNKQDQFGRSTMLPSFLALSLLDADVQKVLAGIPMPGVEKVEDGNLDAGLTNLGNRLMDMAGRKLSGQDANADNVQAGLESLMDVLVNSVEDEENFLSQVVERGGNYIDKGNSWVSGALSAGSKKLNEKAKAIRDQKPGKITGAVANMTNIIAAIVDQGEADELAKGLMSYMNRNPQIFRSMREMANELVGRTEGDNSLVVDKIKSTKAVVSKGREQFRERLPKLIADKFSRDLEDQEWSDLHLGLGQTDVLSVFGSKTMDQLVDLMGNQTRIAGEITTLEDAVKEMARNDAHGREMLYHANLLGRYMATGERAGMRYYNAYALADLVGGRRLNEKTNMDLVRALDEVSSLYAMQALPQGTKDTLTKLAKEETDGLNFVMSYMAGLRADEVSKLEGKAIYNHYKGYINAEQQQGVNLIVAPASEYNKLVTLGYKEVAPYKGSVQDTDPQSRSYFFAPVSGNAPYNQGLVQTVRPTAYGVDPMTGYSFGVMTAGRITDVNEVASINASQAANNGGNENLRAIYDARGKIIAYERMVDHVQQDRLNRNTNLSEMIGAWRGRQFEEHMGRAFNAELVDTLSDMWERDRKDGREDEYINLFDKAEQAADNVLADSMKLLPIEMQNQIRDAFGSDGFMVRRDMILDVMGERAASIGDAWTGNSRFSKQAQDRIQKLAIGVFGVDAYKYAVNTEKFYQTVISDAKKNIVIKSVVVPVANLVSNVYQLSSRGVPLAAIIKGMPKKTLEIDNYVQMELQYMKYDAEFRAAKASDDVVEANRLTRQMTAIRDAQKRMSIWPLIEAGEFSTISEGLDFEDGDLFKGKLVNYFDRLVGKAPEGVRTAARYAWLTQDTALFKGLQKTVDYGDFIAKAILYDDLVKRKGGTKADALAQVTEEFINYDRLRGRGRQYLESMGMMWFWNYKVRAAKIAANMIRNNPIHALLAGLAPVPSFVGSIGTPITDNVFSVALNGNLGYSIGPGQALRGYTMNPWVNLFS